MTKIIEDFTASMAFETGLSFAQATTLVDWMENEGVLDYDILKETYSEPTVREGVRDEMVVGGKLVANDA